MGLTCVSFFASRVVAYHYRIMIEVPLSDFFYHLGKKLFRNHLIAIIKSVQDYNFQNGYSCIYSLAEVPLEKNKTYLSKPVIKSSSFTTCLQLLFSGYFYSAAGQ